MTEHTFTLSIRLGNAAMQEPWHVAEAIVRIAGAVESGDARGKVRDLNGNTVGGWEVSYPREDAS